MAEENNSNKYLKAAVIIMVTIGMAGMISKFSSVMKEDESAKKEEIQPVKLSNPAGTTSIYRFFQKIKSKQDILDATLAEAKALYDSNEVVFLDTRGKAYEKGHIKGALDFYYLALDNNLEKYGHILRGRLLVVYCSGVDCGAARLMANRLFDKGYRKLAYFSGGWPAWEAAGYPSGKKKPQ